MSRAFCDQRSDPADAQVSEENLRTVLQAGAQYVLVDGVFGTSCTPGHGCAPDGRCDGSDPLGWERVPGPRFVDPDGGRGALYPFLARQRSSRRAEL